MRRRRPSASGDASTPPTARPGRTTDAAWYAAPQTLALQSAPESAGLSPELTRRCRQMHANNGRDHKAVLELPANLDEIPKEKQCDWIKKQYKKLAKKCATT